MKTIMLVCSAGMSTSLLVTKMEAAAKEENFDAEIFAVSSTEANNTLAEKNVDVLLLGPQVRFMQKQYEDKLADKGIPVAVINMAAENALVEAHHAQTGLLTQEAQGNNMEISLLAVHSQDHLMTSIAFTDLAKEIVDLYKRID